MTATLAPASAGQQLSDIHERYMRGLDFLWLEVTGKCNLRCVHCYADSSPTTPLHQVMHLEDWHRALQQASDLGCRKVQFIGGEPTLYPHLVDLIYRAHSLGFEFIEVFTNGTVLSDKLKNAVKSCSVHLAFSVYSSDPASHDRVTARAGSFLKTVAAIKWAVEERVPIRAAIIDMAENAGQASDTARFLQSLGVEWITTDSVRGVGRGADHKRVVSIADELCGRCWQGKLCVTATGDVFPCVFSRSNQVGTARQGLRHALRSDALHEFRSRVRNIAAEMAGLGCNPQCGPDCPPATCPPQGG